MKVLTGKYFLLWKRTTSLKYLNILTGEYRVNKGAASILEMHPNTLRSRMSKLGIRRSTSVA